MAVFSFAASIAQREQEENLNFAMPSIKKTKAVERLVMETIAVLDGCRPGNRRLFVERA